jgi:LysM repeat protein
MTPVILDQRRFDIRLPVFRADRAPGQAILVGLLGLAFVALLVARPSSNGGVNPAGFDASASPGQSTSAATDGAVASPPASAPQLTPSPETTEVPIDSVSPSSPTPSSPRPIASPSSEPSTQPATSGATYKVKSGDTLSAIASRFGTTTRVLIRLNGITDPSRLKVGQILKLP